MHAPKITIVDRRMIALDCSTRQLPQMLMDVLQCVVRCVCGGWTVGVTCSGAQGVGDKW